jgi:hypothetical protein
MTCDECRTVPGRCFSATASELLAAKRHIQDCERCQEWLSDVSSDTDRILPGLRPHPAIVAAGKAVAAKVSEYINSDPEASK